MLPCLKIQRLETSNLIQHSTYRWERNWVLENLRSLPKMTQKQRCVALCHWWQTRNIRLKLTTLFLRIVLKGIFNLTGSACYPHKKLFLSRASLSGAGQSWKGKDGKEIGTFKSVFQLLRDEVKNSLFQILGIKFEKVFQLFLLTRGLIIQWLTFTTKWFRVHLFPTANMYSKRKIRKTT